MTDVFPVEVFATGRWAGMDWTEDDLQQIADNFGRLHPKGVRPPVKLGHDENQVFGGQRDGQPALGWVEGVKRVGQKLVADIAGVPTALKEMIRSGRYRRVSSELYPMWEKTPAERNLKSGVKGKVLSAIAFLGADVPEVKTLEDLGRFLATDGAALAFAQPARGVVTCTLDAAPRTRRTSSRVRLEEKMVRMQERLQRQLDRNEVRLQRLSEPVAEKFRDLVGRIIEALGLDPASEQDRRRAAEIALRERRELDPGGQVVEELVTGHPASQPPPTATTVPESGKTTWGRQPAKARFDHNEIDAAVEKLAMAEGLDATDPVQRSQAATLLIEREPERVPLLGYDAIEAERLGGESRFRRLRQIAAKNRMDLTKRHDRDWCETALWNEIKPTVAGARCFRRGRPRAGEARVGAQVLRARRPREGDEDARGRAARPVERYGSARDETPPPRKPRPEPEEAAQLFAEAVEREIVARGLDPLSDRDRREATRRVAMLRPELVPAYGRQA